MKQKVHFILLIIIIGSIFHGLVDLLISKNTAQKWESIVNRFGGEKINNAKTFVEQYHRSGVKGLQDRFHPNLLSQFKKTETSPIMNYFFKSKPQAIKSLDYQFHKDSTEVYRRYTFQFDFLELPPMPLFSFFQNDFLKTKGAGPYSLVLTLDEAERDNKTQIINFSINPLSIDQKQMGDFHLAEKGPFHLAFLIVSVLVPVFIIFSLIQFVRMPASCQKTIWFIFIAVGLADFTLNWTTGDISSNFVSAILLGCGCNKTGVYNPWMISLSLPVGACLFWFKRKKWIAEYRSDLQATSIGA